MAYYGAGHPYHTTGYSYNHRRMTLEQQKKHVEKLLKKSGGPKPGQTWYAIDSDWYMRFNETDEKPGTIDNTNIFDENRNGLKYDIEEKSHYELLPEDVYKFLALFYRPAPVLKFKVKKDSNQNPVIDLYPAYFEIEVERVEEDSEKEDEADLQEEDTTPEKQEENENKIKETDHIENEDKPQNDNEKSDKGNSKGPKVHMLSMSRYSKLGKLKGSIARLLSLRPQQLTIYVQESGSSNFTALNELSEEELSTQIYETLVDIGKKVWKVKCTVTEIDESALNAHEAFSRDEPKVGQRVDAKMQDRWLEGEIVEIIPPKQSSESEKAVLKVKVHYLSFDSSKDKIFDIASEDIDVAYAHLADWRQQTRKGLKVEINKSVYSMSNDWIEAEIVAIDRKGVSKLKSLYAKQLASRHTRKGEKSLIKKVKAFFIRPKPQERKSSKSPGTRNRSDTVDSDDLDISYHGLVQVAVRVASPNMYTTYYRQEKRYVVDLGSQDIAVLGTHLQKKKATHFVSLTSKDVSKKPKAHGVVGFRNLGNTCYMNSILQCLMGTEEMTQYFLSGAYEKDVNRKNPIGFGGRVAIAYGKLVKKYFSDSYSIIAPSEFKRVFGSCCTTFAGTSQQDSQEFLNQLLDALHEDLNRVLDKPAVEAPDSDGRSDKELAEISWDNHLARNKSMFIDNMFGLLKSHLTCPNKGASQATKFDPFSNLVLPIPVKDEYIVNIVFVTAKPRRVRVKVEAYKDKKFEVHEIVDDSELELDPDDDIRLTRHFRFNYLVKGFKLYGTRCVAWLAEKMAIPGHKVSLHVIKNNGVLKCINDPLSEEMFFIRVNEKMQFIAYENNEIDFPELRSTYDRKLLKSKNYYHMFTQKAKPTAKTEAKAIEDSKEIPKAEVAKEKEDKVISDEEKEKKANETNDLNKNPSAGEETEKASNENPEEQVSDTNPNKDEKKEVGSEKVEKAKTGEIKRKSGEKPKTTKKESSEEEEEEEEEEERYELLILQYKKLGAAYYSSTVKHDEVFLFDTEKTTFADIFKAAWVNARGIINFEHPKLKLKDDLKDTEEAELLVARKAIKIMYDKQEITPDENARLKLKKTKYSFQKAAARTVKVFFRSTDIFKKGIKSTVASSYYLHKKPTIEELDNHLNVGFVAHTPSIREFAKKKELITLKKCFKALNTPEKLEKNDWWYCGKCKEHVAATKKMDVFSAGKILIIVLKRFKAGAAMIRRKIEEPVYFPLKDLDLSEYIQSSEHSKIYDLYAVSYHSGGLGGGHYTARVKVEKQWYSFNDASVQPCKEEDVINRYAYVLFYRRRDTI